VRATFFFLSLLSYSFNSPPSSTSSFYFSAAEWDSQKCLFPLLIVRPHAKDCLLFFVYKAHTSQDSIKTVTAVSFVSICINSISSKEAQKWLPFTSTHYNCTQKEVICFKHNAFLYYIAIERHRNYHRAPLQRE
jgi:hypothetical protein